MLQGVTGAGGGLTVLLLQMAAIGLVFYFLILRPSGQARRKHADLLSGLKKGDEVMTSGGIIGRVREITEKQVQHIEVGRPPAAVAAAVAEGEEK